MAGILLTIHYGDYGVFRDPIENFEGAVGRAELATEVRMVGRGETFTFPVRP